MHLTKNTLLNWLGHIMPTTEPNHTRPAAQKRGDNITLTECQGQANEQIAQYKLGAWAAGNLAVGLPHEQPGIIHGMKGHFVPHPPVATTLSLELLLPPEDTPPMHIDVCLRALEFAEPHTYSFQQVATDALPNSTVKITSAAVRDEVAQHIPFVMIEDFLVKPGGLYKLAFVAQHNEQISVDGQQLCRWTYTAEGKRYPYRWECVDNAVQVYDIDMFELVPVGRC